MPACIPLPHSPSPDFSPSISPELLSTTRRVWMPPFPSIFPPSLHFSPLPSGTLTRLFPLLFWHQGVGFPLPTPSLLLASPAHIIAACDLSPHPPFSASLSALKALWASSGSPRHKSLPYKSPESISHCRERANWGGKVEGDGKNTLRSHLIIEFNSNTMITLQIPSPEPEEAAPWYPIMHRGFV